MLSSTFQEGEEEIWFRWRLEGIMSSGETRVSVVSVRRLGEAEMVGSRRSDAWRTDGQDLHTCLASASSTHAYPSLSVLGSRVWTFVWFS